MYDDNNDLEVERVKWLKVKILEVEKENIQTQLYSDPKMVEKITDLVKTGVNGKLVRR